MWRLVVFVVTLSASISSQSVSPLTNRSPESCSIPNETALGVCKPPNECHAFQEINDVINARSIGRLSFLRKLQCSDTMTGEDGVCCPRTGRHYSHPTMNESMPLRERIDLNFIAPRIADEYDDQCGQPTEQGKVMGGQIADIDDFPWMAMLLYGESGSPGCGGVLISSSFVVTAAHCLVGPSIQKKGNLKYVRLGEYNIHSDPDCLIVDSEQDCTDGKIDLKPKRWITHPQYVPSSRSQHHDVGLVELPQRVEFSEFIRHICLPEVTHSNAVFTPGTNFNVCGWGRTNFFRGTIGDYSPSPVKLKATLALFDHRDCRQIYQMQQMDLGGGQMCVGGKKADSCAGDSGSPLMYYDRMHGRWILTGVVSLGVQKCDTEGRPGIYTKVADYISWIKKNSIASG